MTQLARRIVIGTVLAAAVVLLGIWIMRPGTATVDLAVATRGPLQVTLDVDGVTRVLHRIRVRAPVSGRLLSTTLEAGDPIRRGDPLFTIVAGRNPTSLGARTRVTVRAPLTGRVLRVLEEHERLIASGTPLMDVGDPHDVEVIAQLPAAEAAEVRDGLPMLVRPKDAETTLHAVVARLDSGAAMSSPAPQLSVHGTFATPTRGVGDGSPVRVSVVLWSSADVLRVPRTALVPVKEGWQVFRVQAGRARPVRVTVGHRGIGEAEVVTGLAPGDTVVALPTDQVRAGVHIKGQVYGAGS